jgi:hypothetical protein
VFPSPAPPAALAVAQSATKTTRGCKDAAGVERCSYTTQSRYAGRFYLSDDRREFGGSLGSARLTVFYPGAASRRGDTVLRHVVPQSQGAGRYCQHYTRDLIPNRLRHIFISTISHHLP